jgi:CRP-like cAMP-binding protein
VVFYSGFEFPGTAVALESTSCLVIERATLFDLLERRPSLVRGLLLGLTRQLFDLRSKLVEITAGHS